MSFVESIIDLQTDTLVVTRRAVGSFDVNGVWAPGASSAFIIIANVQPATGMQRVAGGRDMRSDEQGQHTDDVRVCYTETLLRTRDSSYEPDLITYQGGSWNVVRVEQWQLDDEVYYRALITRETRGAS